ncbi:hypothetical protein F4604DRAFT_1927275 [Suillus subluteus]|nr:hypothetical protein F4604DRAFT_1927275 [Suillus subluteus]
MTPLEIANDALNATLEAVQSMMKRCMKLKEDDPVTLTLSDEIARQVAKDLKLHGGSTTSFSPRLLSCAATVRQCSKAGAFVSLPNWNAVVDNDPHINTPTVPQDCGLSFFHSLCQRRTRTHHVVICCTGESAISDTDTHKYDPGKPLISDIQSTVTAAEVQEPPAPLPPSIASVTVRHNIFVARNIKMEAKATMPPPTKTKKRKAEADNSEPVPPPVSRKALSVKACNAVAPADMSASDFVDERGFWDAETRPTGWGDDCNIATAVEHSVRYHPQKCDKCIKLDVPCIVLPNKKFRCIRLACSECDEMKITCAIDSAGIRQRLQAKAKEAVIKPRANPLPKCSRTRAPKSGEVAKTPLTSAPPKTTKPATHSYSHAEKKVVLDNSPIEARQLPMDLMPDHMNVQAPSNMQSFGSFDLPEVQPPAPVNMAATVPDVLHGIHELGRKFDLLATNDRMDALDARVDSVEQRISLRLMVLEERFATSDAHMGSASPFIGNLSRSLQADRNDRPAHSLRASGTTHALQHCPEPPIASWLTRNPASDRHPGVSTMGREHTNVRGQSVVMGMQGDTGTSTSIWQPTHTVNPPYVRADSIESSRLSSSPTVTCEE